MSKKKGETIRKKILRNVFFLYSSQLVQFLLSFLFLTLLARRLEVSDFGRYAYLIAFYSVALTAVTFGLDQLIIREVAREKSSASSYLSTVLLTKSIFSAGGILFSFLFSFHLPSELKGAFLIYLPFLIFNNFTLTFWYLADAYERMEFRSLLSVLYQGLRVIFGLFFLFISPTLPSLFTGLLLAEVLTFGLVLLVITIKFRIKLARPCSLAKILRPSFPFALAVTFASLFYRTDVLVLKGLADDHSLGVYGLAQRLVSFVLLLAVAFADSVYPVFSRFYIEFRDQLARIFARYLTFLFLAGLVCSLGIFILAKPLLPLFFGNKFLPSLKPLNFLVISLPFLFGVQSFFVLFSAVNRQHFNIWLSIMGIALIVLLSPTLFSVMGISGVALSFSLASFTVFLTSTFLARYLWRWSQ